MTQRKVYILLGSLTILLVVYLLSFILGKAPPDFVRSLNAIPEKFNRSYTSTVQFQISDLTDTSSIFRPSTLRIFEEKIYISDFSDFSIYEYDKEGNQTRKIETGRGRGPGEFQNLTDFDLIRDTLWAVDVQNFTISSFSVKTGEFIDNISVDRRPLRITCLEDGFIVQWLGTELLFSQFDYKGNELNKFGKVVENQLQHTLSLTGTIRSNQKDRFVYIPFYASLIYQYQKDGELINVIKTPDGIHFPTTRREGAQSYAPDFAYMRDGFIDEDDRLYVYTRLQADEHSEVDWATQSIVDIYNLISAKYETSIQLPVAHSTAIFDNNENMMFSVDKAKGRSYIIQLKD